MKIAGRGVLAATLPRAGHASLERIGRLAARLRLFRIAGALGDQIRREQVLSTAAPISWTTPLAFWPAVAQLDCSKQRLSLDAPSQNQQRRSAPISRLRSPSFTPRTPRPRCLPARRVLPASKAR